MPIVRDLKNRDSKKILSLKKEEGKIVPKKPENILDLSKKHKKEKPIKAYDIAIKKERSSKFVFFASKQKAEKTTKNYSELFRFAISAILVVFLFNVLHIGNQVFNIATDVEAEAFKGYINFVEGGKDALDSNFGGAVQYFEAASYAFSEAQSKVWFLGNQSILNTKQSLGDSAYSILESGEHLSDAASYFSQGISGLQEIPVLFLENNTESREELPVTNVSITEKLQTSLNLFNNALDEVKIAQSKLKFAGSDFLPANLKENFNTLTVQLDNLVNILEDMQIRVPAILNMLGDRYPHRYLVLLQNNTEARPTGGFIGSYMIVDVNDGYITKVDFHDIYESDGQLTEHILAPQEIAELTDNWRMRDSNYSPHFPLSAAKAAWFLEKEEGPGVDSVIAINQSILEDLLTVIGPIEIEGLSAPLTSSNYNTVLTYIIESKLEGEDKPKEILNRLIPALQDKIYDKASFKSLFAVIQKGVQDKDILGWSKSEYVQKFFQDVGMSSEVTEISGDQDYFSLITVNIGGNKSDLYIDSDVLHETIIDKSGNLYNVVTYKRKHTWSPNIVLDWQKKLEPFGYTDLHDGLQNILGKGNNKSIIKMYLPEGSEIEEIVGVESEDVTIGFDDEVNKAYLYFINEVAPQNESKVTVKYKLPYKLDLSLADEYRLTVQKQPGNLHDVKLKKRIIADSRINNLRNYPEEVVYNQGDVLEYETTLKTDQHFASLWSIE